MYVGRFLVVGPEGGAYRVSSRSFPNRRIADRDGTLTVGPTADAPPTENPYVSYNCVRLVARGSAGPGGVASAGVASAGGIASAGGDGTGPDTAVLGNGSHVDPIAEKLTLGYPPRDALAAGLLALDFEKDDYDTPRIAGTVTHPDALPDAGGAGDGTDDRARAHVGTVRRDALVVRAVEEPTLVATYERDDPGPSELPVGDAAGAARAAFDADFEHAVCAAGVAPSDAGGFETAIVNGADE